MSRSAHNYRMVVDRDVMVPMRDGTLLATDIYRPTFGIGLRSGRFPVILVRTIYDKSDELQRRSAEYFCRRGYVAAVQDCRGRFNSEGDYYHMADEAEDGFDTVEWLASQSWSNGKVGTWGGSYLSQVQSAMATQAPPHLSAMVPMYGPSNVYSYGLRHDGAFQLKFFTVGFWLGADSKESRLDPAIGEKLQSASIREWLCRLPIEKGKSPLSLVPNYERWVLDFMTRGDYDEYWANPSFDIEAHVNRHADVPVFLVGGWYDSWSRATVTQFTELSRRKRGPIRLLMGPWTHGGHSLTYAGDAELGRAASVDGNLADDFNDWLLRRFDHTLKGVDNGIGDELPIRLFVMGGGSGRKNPEGRLDHGGRWRDEMAWPLPRTLYTPYFLHPGNRLSPRAPGPDAGFSRYRFDPQSPVPTLGGNLSGLSELIPVGDGDQTSYVRRPIIPPGAAHQATYPGCFGCRPPYGPLSDREDVLAFETGPLDRDMELTGPITVRLWVSSTAPDTDFTAKLLDIYPPSTDYPDGYHLNISDGIVRARYRSFSGKAELLEPGKIYRVDIVLEPTSNLFAAGHRIRLDISSSNFPRFDVNPNTGEPVGRHTHTVPADNTVCHDAVRPSHVVLPVVPG